MHSVMQKDEMSSYTKATALASCSGVRSEGSIGLSDTKPGTVDMKVVVMAPISVVMSRVVSGVTKKVEKTFSATSCHTGDHRDAQAWRPQQVHLDRCGMNRQTYRLHSATIRVHIEIEPCEDEERNNVRSLICLIHELELKVNAGVT
eukprot:scaffold624_cov402-Prasinococcus_capsulatus_cf.AAC.48